MGRRGDFSKKQKAAIRDRAAGLCEVCGALGRDADHRLPLGLGGDGSLDNAQLLCERHHKDKTAREKGMMAKADRARKKLVEGKKRKWHKPIQSRGFQGWRRFNGERVRKT